MINISQLTSPNEISQSDRFSENNILNLLPSGVYVCSLSGELISYNKKAVELWGRTPSQDDKHERWCGAFRRYYSNGDYMPHNESPAAAGIASGLAQKSVEVIIERPDLSRIFVKMDVNPIRDEHGNLTGIVICFYDVTDEKKSELEHNFKTKQLQDYVDNASVGLHWVDGSGTIIWANKKELDMLGYKPEEYIGHHIAEFHVDQEKIADILHRLTCNETLNSYESVIRCKNGANKTVQISSNVLWENDKFIHTRCFTIDVTEQKKLDEALKESESRYKKLINGLSAGIYSCDKEGRITYYNEVAEQLWGYSPDITSDSLKFCACYKVWKDGIFMPPDQTPMAVALRTGQKFRNIEALVERPDGSSFYANVNIDPVFDESNNITGAINIFNDITNVKQAEYALKESEQRYRTLMHALDTALYTTDCEGEITLYNKAASALWGREPEVGKDFWCGSYRILKEDGNELPLEACPMAICIKERRPVYGEEIVVVRPDGSLRNVAPHSQPLLNTSGEMIGAVNMLVDITGLKQIETALRKSEQQYQALTATLEKNIDEKTADLKKKNEALKRSEERYHKMVDEVEDYAIILLDNNGFIQNWNKGAQKIKGYTEEEIVGKSFEIFYFEDDRRSGLPGVLIESAKREGKAVAEGWRRRKDNSKFWGSTVITALHDEPGNIIGFTKVTRDLTERKQAEDRLKEYSAQLEFQNGELEQFAYAASHDMKEPLRKTHFYTSYISDNSAYLLDDKSKEYLARAMTSLKRMNQLIEDLLTYSKMTSGKASFENVELNTVVEEIISGHKEELEQQEVRIEIGDLPKISGISFQCKQLMDNIINNAIKYKHPDRKCVIKINSEIIKGSTIKGIVPDNFYYKISVIDNGIGFDNTYAEQIFDVFKRLANSPVKGSGIGLAICKKIAHNHNGLIMAQGSINNGARFDIFFPVKN